MAEKVHSQVMRACPADQECPKACRRKSIWKSPKWFGGWLDIEEWSDDCSFYIEFKSPVSESLFNKMTGKS